MSHPARAGACVLTLTFLQLFAGSLAAEQADAVHGIALAPPSRWAVGLDGYGGLLLQMTSGEDRPHVMGGGQLRVRYHYFQAGAFIDMTDSGEARGLLEPSQESFRTIGGFVGGWFPFTNWVDVDAALGFGSRRYVNPLAIYGEDGLRETTGVTTFRLGISDRYSERDFSFRAGAALVGSVDLDPRHVTWRRRYLRWDGTIGETKGTTPIGGVSIGLFLTLGAEMCPCEDLGDD